MGFINPPPSTQNQRAPIEKLSPSKRKALVACLSADGTLYRCRGAWSPNASGAADLIFGITVADLIRDGLLALSNNDRRAPARLTPLGKWYAQTAASDHQAL